jgi:phosphomannomutase
MSISRNLKIGVSGVRGVVGETLSPTLVADFASAFGEFLGGGRVIIGRDTRSSGVMLEHAVAAGLTAVGCQPALAGIIPTPTAQIAAKLSNASGAIAITASHNSIEWNALKFIGPSGLFLNPSETSELLDIYNQPDSDYVPEQDFRYTMPYPDAFGIHKDRILASINLGAIRKARFKVAVDCCNGVGALFSKSFLEALGCEVVAIFDSPDGIFGRPPEPLPRNLERLSRTIRENSCHVGFAQDPDGDRIAIAGPSGIPVGEQNSILLAADHILSRTPGNVVVNIQTTKAVEDIAAAKGFKTFYSPVGEVNVSSMMLDTDAVFGAEGSSGGVIWPVIHHCRDSFSAMAVTLEMMALRAMNVDEMLKRLPTYHSSALKIECGSQDATNALRTLAKRYASERPILTDGVRINFKDAWILIRQSNTEQALRIMAEARSSNDAESLANKFAGELAPLLQRRG